MVDDTAPRPRLVIFGDSHYACVRQAQNQGLVDVTGAEIEYWGHVGGRFRNLSCENGIIAPTDDFTAKRFAKFNEKGRETLAVADFDMVLFVGVRIYPRKLFLRLLQTNSSGPPISNGLRRRLVRDQLSAVPYYGFAKDFAKAGNALICLSPTSFVTQGYAGDADGVSDAVRACGTDERTEIWSLIAREAKEDGIELLPQPEETVVDGVFTSPDYAVKDYEKKQDFEHRNAAYGALILSQTMTKLRNRFG